METWAHSGDCDTSPRTPGHILEAARAWPESAEAGLVLRPGPGEDRGRGCPWPVLVPEPGLLLMTWSGLAMDCQYCQYCHIATHCQSDTSWHLVVAPRQSRGEVTTLWSARWGDNTMSGPWPLLSDNDAMSSDCRVIAHYKPINSS